MRFFKYLLVGSFLLSLHPVTAYAATWSLSGDFSTANNPNGVWSYNLDGTPIGQNVSNGTVAGGWGYMSSLDGSIMQWTNSTGYDMQDGDVTIHTLSTTYGGSNIFAGITFTAPSDGVYSITGSAWDIGHFSSLGRDANWTLSVGDTLVAESINGVNGIGRSASSAQFSEHLLPTMSLANIGMTQGEKIAFLTATTGTYGGFMGVAMNVSSVPLPAAFWLFGSGVVGLAGMCRKCRQKRA